MAGTVGGGAHMGTELAALRDKAEHPEVLAERPAGSGRRAPRQAPRPRPTPA